MKQEEVNQKLRTGDLVLVATANLREKILERGQRLIDGVRYVALSDLLREVNEIRSMLLRMRSKSRRYAVAVPADVAESVMLAMLLIPGGQAELADGDDGIGSAGNTQKPDELVRAGDDARRIASKLWGVDDAAPTIELWDRELSKLGPRRELSEQLLVAARTADGKAHGASGQPLADLPLAPKSLPSANHEDVELHVKSVDEDPGLAIVVVMGAAHPHGPAMAGLFERRVRLTFDEELHPGVAKFLELAQVTDFHVLARVRVHRGLGARNAKHDELQLAEVIDERGSRDRISRRLLEMNAVTVDLFEALPDKNKVDSLSLIQVISEAPRGASTGA